MKEYEFHEVANIFPLLTGDDYVALRDDIAANGLHEPIWLHPDGRIIDGRNRYIACLDAGVEPRFRTWGGDGSLVSFVVSLNLHRRHLTASQRAALAVDVLPMLEKENPPGRPVDNNVSNHGHISGRNTDVAGSMFGVGKSYVSDAKKISQEAPDLLDQVRIGDITLPQAKREMVKRETIEKLDTIAAQQPAAIDGVFDVIVIDPPWPMKKIERDVTPNQVEFEYPTMSLDEIAAMDIPAANDCHLFVWTTQKYLPPALDIVKGWGFKYVLTFVWHKNGGFQPFGLPMYNCEFVVYARIGNPQFFDFKNFLTCFNAPRKSHSEKPEEFYETLRRVTRGRRLDMFNRRKIDGFIGWGNEA